MAPSVTSTSGKGTPTLKPTTPPSPESVPSPLFISEDMSPPDPSADDASETPATAGGTSSSFPGTHTSAGVTGRSGDVGDENDTYGFNIPELQSCCRALADTAAAVDVGKRDVDENADPDKSDDDYSSDDGDGELRTPDNFAQAPGGYRDPFPSLSPMPSRKTLQPTLSQSSSKSLQHSNSSLQSSCDRLYEHAVDQYIGSFKSFQHNNSHTNISPMKSSKKRSSTGSSSPITPSATETPPLISRGSRATTPTPLSSSSDQTTPLKAACNNAQKMWIDPFPTPDVSRCNSYSTPCSSRVRTASQNTLDGDDGEKILNADWETLLGKLPQIPPIEELSPDLDEKRKRINVVNTSCPRLHSMGVEDLPVRRISSESKLPMIKRRSLDDLWGALKSGPDGNDLVTDYGNGDWEGRRVKERRNSEKGMDWSEPLESSDGVLETPLTRREQRRTFPNPDVGMKVPICPKVKEHMFRRTHSSPIDASRGGLRHRPLHSGSDENGNNNSKNNQSIARHDSRMTITNVTGADLAKEVKMRLDKREGSPQTPLTPNRLSFHNFRALSTRAVRAATAKNAEGELIFSPVRTVRGASRKAKTIVQNTRRKLEERKERRRQRRLARMKEPPRSWWIVIPADHPYKIAWDVMTMLWALLGAYRTHVRIRDRVFDQSPLIILTEIWFTVDILLNFVTEHKTRKGEVIRDGKAIWARYLTTWFIIDILSLIPWERIYVRPVVEKIKKRNFFQKSWFRSKAVVRVSRVLRGRHIRLFGKVSKQTGTPLRRMVALVIKYLPKYLVFLRNMKGALVVRALRFVHWLHNMYKKIWVKARNARRNLAARRAARRQMGHPLFSPIRSNEDHSDSDDSGDDVEDDEEDEEVDTDSEEEDDEGFVLLNESDREDLTSFHRAHSEGSPLVAPRRRSFSQNEMWLR